MSVTLNSNVQVSTSQYSDRNKGIRVSTDEEHPVSIFIAIKISKLVQVSFDSYKIHQNADVKNLASYEYFALSTDYNGETLINRKSEVLLTANHDNTIVSITPTQGVLLPQDAQNPSSSLIVIAPGTTHNVTLNRFQTLLVYNSTFDITGTRIVSDKPLTVLTGHQCAQFPTTTQFCEPVHVQLPPSFTWGQNFLLVPFAGRSSEQRYKIVTSQDNTTIVYKCGTLAAVGKVLETAGQGEYLILSAGSYCSLVTTNPVFVVQLGAGFHTDSSGDPVMAVVSPTTSYVNSTTVLSSPADLFSTSFLSITVLPENFNNQSILLDDNMTDCDWTEIYNTSGIAGYACNINTTDGPMESLTVSHDEGGLLSVTAYGWNTMPAWGFAYLAGMSLDDAEGD